MNKSLTSRKRNGKHCKNRYKIIHEMDLREGSSRILLYNTQAYLIPLLQKANISIPLPMRSNDTRSP